MMAPLGRTLGLSKMLLVIPDQRLVDFTYTH
jgi:hypothetical protein